MYSVEEWINGCIDTSIETDMRLYEIYQEERSRIRWCAGHKFQADFFVYKIEKACKILMFTFHSRYINNKYEFYQSGVGIYGIR